VTIAGKERRSALSRETGTADVKESEKETGIVTETVIGDTETQPG
jgi:hypothetical protein